MNMSILSIKKPISVVFLSFIKLRRVEFVNSINFFFNYVSSAECRL